MADSSLPTSKAGKQERRTCLHGNPECTRIRLELNLASCSPIPVSRPLTYTIIACGRERVRQCFKTFAGKRVGYFWSLLAKHGSVSQSMRM
jgi:hypothetical protein